MISKQHGAVKQSHKLSEPEFYEGELVGKHGKKKAHFIRIANGSHLVDEVVSEADKKHYPKEYAAFVASLGKKSKAEAVKEAPVKKKKGKK